MMNQSTYKIIATDGKPLHTYKWMPDNLLELKAILLIVHGSVEHAKRYERFAEFITANSIGVYAFDLRGHGYTTDLDKPEFAHIPYKTGWDQLMDDVDTVRLAIAEEFPKVPKFLFGHSMGSFLVRDYITSRSSDLNGLILSGTTFGYKLEIQLLLNVVRFMMLFRDQKYKSQFVHDQIYAKLNNSIENPQTPVDFISTDKHEVEKYLEDPLSGKTISLGYAHEMGKGLLRVRQDESIAQIPRDLPILMISGADDPVGDDNKTGVKKLYETYKQRGMNHVQLKLYDGARHEILNDFVKDEVMQDILTWIEKYK